MPTLEEKFDGEKKKPIFLTVDNNSSIKIV